MRPQRNGIPQGTGSLGEVNHISVERKILVKKQVNVSRHAPSPTPLPPLWVHGFHALRERGAQMREDRNLLLPLPVSILGLYRSVFSVIKIV